MVAVADGAVVADTDAGIGDVGMTMGLEVELGVAEMWVAAEVVADVEEDGVNVVDILCCLFVACLLFVFVGCCVERARVGCVWQYVAVCSLSEKRRSC